MSDRALFACLHVLPAPAGIDDPRGMCGEPHEDISSSSTSTMGGSRALMMLAEDFSPRFERHRDDLIVIDVCGLERLLGHRRIIGEELRRVAAGRGFRMQVALADTWTAAMTLAFSRPGLTVVDAGGHGEALAPISVDVLSRMLDSLPASGSRKPSDHLDRTAAAISAIKGWGIRTLGELAALPSSELAARLGRDGPLWQAVARGQDIRPLVPTLPEERFESSIDLEWPIEELEPLSFVLTRLLEPLATRLERRDRGAAVLHVTLGLVKNHDARDEHDEGRQDHYTRSLQLPSPLRDVRTLRTLILLDLESHPPPAPIERVAVFIEPTPGRIWQHTLFARAHPTPEQLSTLLARLTALMGQDRIGRPEMVDSDRPGVFSMLPFATDCRRASVVGRQPSVASHQSSDDGPSIVSALRRCRRPVPARVALADGRPVYVTTDRRGFAGGRVRSCVGPWRTSGNWWERGAGGKDSSFQPVPLFWNHEEWDLSLADGTVYRIFQDRETEGWFIEAIVD